MLLLAAGLVFFVVVYQRRLYEQREQRQAEELRHQRQLLQAVVEVQENERRRIASDLHDDIGSLLSAARLYLRQFATGPEDSKNTAIKAELLTILDEMIANARRITHDLMPAELAKFGFVAAAQDLLARLTESGGIRASFRGDTKRRLPPTVEIALYRVLQELVANTLRHAAATHITLDCEWEGKRLYLRYTDDGKGFAPDQLNRPGLGLRNIESRVGLVGGELDYRSAPGEGLSVRISVPGMTGIEGNVGKGVEAVTAASISRRSAPA